jgi:hypothetical protein
MARRNLSSTSSRIVEPLRLTDVDIVTEAEEGQSATKIDGIAVATLLDVAADTDRLLDPEDIALELDHVADVLGALAGHAQPPTAGALFLAEHCLRGLAARVEALRPGARAHARRFVIERAVREALRDYAADAGIFGRAADSRAEGDADLDAWIARLSGDRSEMLDATPALG